MGPCFGVSALWREVDERNVRRQRNFHYGARIPPSRESLPTKSVLDSTASLNVVCSSDRSVDRFTDEPVHHLMTPKRDKSVRGSSRRRSLAIEGLY